MGEIAGPKFEWEESRMVMKKSSIFDVVRRTFLELSLKQKRVDDELWSLKEKSEISIFKAFYECELRLPWYSSTMSKIVGKENL